MSDLTVADNDRMRLAMLGAVRKLFPLLDRVSYRDGQAVWAVIEDLRRASEPRRRRKK